jgi:hypothetical protein
VAATAVMSVRKPTGREVVGGQRMREPLIAGPIPSTAAGATHELRDQIRSDHHPQVVFRWYKSGCKISVAFFVVI